MTLSYQHALPASDYGTQTCNRSRQFGLEERHAGGAIGIESSGAFDGQPAMVFDFLDCLEEMRIAGIFVR